MGNARQWYNSKLEYVTMSWANLKDEMVTIFDSTPNKVLLMKAMEARKWKRNEKFSVYFKEKVML